MQRFAVISLAVMALAAPGQTLAAEADPRTPIAMPADLRPAFLAHMRHHMDALDDIIARLAAADFKGAAGVARMELVPGSGEGFGRYLPLEFREMGLAMHRAAAEFAAVAEAVPARPAVADWQKSIAALQTISAQCRGCHGAYRVE
jgi:cytochrome c556